MRAFESFKKAPQDDRKAKQEARLTPVKRRLDPIEGFGKETKKKPSKEVKDRVVAQQEVERDAEVVTETMVENIRNELQQVPIAVEEVSEGQHDTLQDAYHADKHMDVGDGESVGTPAVSEPKKKGWFSSAASKVKGFLSKVSPANQWTNARGSRQQTYRDTHPLMQVPDSANPGKMKEVPVGEMHGGGGVEDVADMVVHEAINADLRADRNAYPSVTERMAQGMMQDEIESARGAGAKRVMYEQSEFDKKVEAAQQRVIELKKNTRTIRGRMALARAEEDLEEAYKEREKAEAE